MNGLVCSNPAPHAPHYGCEGRKDAAVQQRRPESSVRLCSLTEMVSCVEREVRMRERVYPRWVQQGKLSKEKADRELAVMKQVGEALLELGRLRGLKEGL